MKRHFLGKLLVVSAVFVLVLAQVLFKGCFNKYGAVPLELHNFKEYLGLVIVDASFYLGLVAMCVSSGLWYAGLSRLPLSEASPLTSLSYPVVLFTSWWLLGEDVSLTKLAGNLLIFFGVILVLTNRHTNSRPAD